MKAFAVVCAVAACLLSGAALAVSLTHSGPRGAQGPAGRQGDAGQAAQTGRFGVCWSAPEFTQTWADGSASAWVSAVSIDAPVLSGGVYTCPQGDTFTSIVPQSAPASGSNG